MTTLPDAMCGTLRGCDCTGGCIPAAADVIELKTPAGTTFSYETLKAALTQHKPKVLFLCQGESSTGTHQVCM